jgi:archaellum component FlaC
MGNTSDLDTRLSYCRRLIDDAEQNRRLITDGAVRARASSELASAVALVALAERLQDTNDSLKAIAEDTRSLKSHASGIESRLNSIESAVQSVGSSVNALKITIVKVSKDNEK